MDKIILIIFATIATSFFAEANAQENRSGRPFDREAFQAKRNAFITSEMNLTPEEAAKFIPLCDELRNKKFEVGNDCRKLVREVEKGKNLTEADYLKAIDECLEVSEKEAQLEKEYYTQFKKVLSAEKLFKYRAAEFKFAKYFMRTEGDRNPSGERGREAREQQRIDNKESKEIK